MKGSIYKQTNGDNLASFRGPPAWEALVAPFALRYANPSTRRFYERELAALFAFAGVDHPRLVTESMVLAWCGQGRANNSVRNRLSRVCTFLRWCVRQGEADPALVEVLMGRDNPLRQIPRLYGKVQGLRPPRWLSREDAFVALIGACRDGTDLGLRDEAIIRLGLAGMRAAEVIHLRMGDLRLHDAEPAITWIGKNRRARRIVPGPSLVATLEALADRREELLGRPLRSDEPVICCGKSGAGSGGLVPDRPIAQTVSVQQIVGRRAARAGLGHVAPHDLRRTAAGLLHRSVGTDGSHHSVDLPAFRAAGAADVACADRHYACVVPGTVTGSPLLPRTCCPPVLTSIREARCHRRDPLAITPSITTSMAKRNRSSLSPATI